MPEPPTRPALRERYYRRQQAVIATAAATFARRGFQATSMDDLSEATGLASGGLYHYIGSKQRLLLLILEQLMDPLLERAAAIEASGAAPREQLRELLRAWLAHVGAHRDHMLVFAQERHVVEREPEWAEVHASRRRFEAVLARVLDAVAAESPDAGVDRAIVRFALLGMVNHTAQWLRPDGRLSSDAIADGYCEITLRALSGQTA